MVVPIMYGLPTSEAFEAANEGQIGIGGCVVTGEDPAWLCRGCDNRFGRKNRDVSDLASVFFPKTTPYCHDTPEPLTRETSETDSDLSADDEGRA